MPTNAEIHAAIDLLIRQPHSHILTDAIADMLDDMVDNIAAGPGGTPGIDSVLAEGQVLADDREIDLGGNDLAVKGNFSIKNDDGFAAEFDIGDITNDRGFLFPDSGGTFAVVNSIASKQIPWGDTGGKIFECNEDFIYDINTATIGIGALNGNSTITSQTDRNAEEDTLSGVGIIIKGANGGATSGNGGNVILTPGNAGGGGGVAGKVVINSDLVFADNAAAQAGGLTAGMIYRTGDVLKIVH